MKTYSRKQMLFYCGLTLFVFSVSALAFRISPYYVEVRKALLESLMALLPGTKYQASLDDEENAILARKAFEKVVLQRDQRLTPEQQKEMVKIYHSLKIWQHTYYLGIRIEKNPCDLWMMQQIIYEVRPDYIIETGTYVGGSALYFAHMLDGLGLKDSKVITIDIVDRTESVSRLPLWQEKVEFILGSSTDPAIVARIGQRVRGKVVVVDLDSDHSADHVYNELMSYSAMVSPGSYLVVEDTSLDAIPIDPDRSGPMAAVVNFLRTEQGASFVQDITREMMLLSFNPGGWLKKAS